MFNFCPNCGKRNEGWRFCPDCGFDLAADNKSSGFVTNDLDFGKLLDMSEVAVKEKKIEEEKQRTKKLLQQFEYDEHSDNTYTIKKLKDITALKIVVPEGVVSIGDDAFNSECFKLYNGFLQIRIMSISLPNSLLLVGDDAFGYCSYLENLIIPNGVKSIGDRAFACCNSLTSVTLGNSVESIGREAFKYCSSLTSVSIPDSVKQIGGDVFKGCGNLKFISLPRQLQVEHGGALGAPVTCQIIRR